MAKFGALQAGTKRRPGCAAILGGKEGILVEGQDNQSALGMLAVHGHIEDVLVVETVIECRESSAAVFADLNAFALRADDDALGIFRVDHDGVDDPIERSRSEERRVGKECRWWGR